MIDVLALCVSAIALTISGVLLYRDAKRWNVAEHKPTTPFFSRIEAIVKRHQYSTEPGHRTTVAYVKDIIERAEHDAAKIRFTK